MYQQFNDQFTKATSQFADVAANANRLALDNAQKAFGLQLSTFEENTSAAFAFWNELIEVRDVEGFKSVLPKGAQIARAATERSSGFEDRSDSSNTVSPAERSIEQAPSKKRP